MVGLFLLILTVRMLPAQSITINQTDLFVKDHVLFTRLHINNFFDESMRETIASGMSRKFNLTFDLLSPGQKIIYNRVESLSLKYDVWERIYLLNSAEEEKQFADFEKFMLYISDSTVFRLGDIKSINQNDRLQLFIVFARQEISERQQKELKTWILSDAETAESQPGLETNQSFSINISKLLSLFFSRESFADFHIYKSPLFTIESLEADENTPQ